MQSLLCRFLFIIPFSSGVVVTVYERINYQGSSSTLDVNGCLPKLPMVWSIYSAKVLGSGNCVRFYGVEGCKYDFFEIKDNSPSTENTHKYLFWHEKVKSISPCEDYCDAEHQIKYSDQPVVRVDLYKSRYLSGFKVTTAVEYGKCTTIPSEVAGKVSSLRRHKENSCIELYENSDCTGTSVTQRGPNNVQNMVNMEVFDKRARSMSFCGYSCDAKGANSSANFEPINNTTTSNTDYKNNNIPEQKFAKDSTQNSTKESEEVSSFAQLEVQIKTTNVSVHYKIKLPSSPNRISQTVSQLHNSFQEFLNSNLDLNSSFEYVDV